MIGKIIAFSLILGMSSFALADCRDNIRMTTPTADFEIDDVLVYHVRTGLVWQRCNVGEVWNGSACDGDATLFTWSGALQAASDATDQGYSDWRVPNLKELASIIERACVEPAMATDVFFAPTDPLYAENPVYWSVTVSRAAPEDVWVIGFGRGRQSLWHTTDIDLLHVRLVRGGP